MTRHGLRNYCTNCKCMYVILRAQLLPDAIGLAAGSAAAPRTFLRARFMHVRADLCAARTRTRGARRFAFYTAITSEIFPSAGKRLTKGKRAERNISAPLFYREVRAFFNFVREFFAKKVLYLLQSD